MAKFRPAYFCLGLGGKVGGLVFVQRADGIAYVKSKTTPRNPRSPAQVSARLRLTRATAAYRTLNPVQLQAWSDYAARLAVYEQADPRPVFGLFVGLTCRLLQVYPSAQIPLDPPDRLVVGDTVVVTAALAPGQIVFRANRSNGAGVVTELLVQPLSGFACKPRSGHYRSAGFTDFGTSLEFAVPFAGAAFAAAIRFIDPASGVASALFPIAAS